MTGCPWPGPWSSTCTRSTAAARLFATHFHELTALAAKLPRLACHTLRVKEWRGEVVFLHEVAPGTADRSYGIHVARLAGLPEPVLRRATAVLKRLEEGEARSAPGALADDLPLFAAMLREPPPSAASAGPSPVERLLAERRPGPSSPPRRRWTSSTGSRNALSKRRPRGTSKDNPAEKGLARATSSVDAPWSGRPRPGRRADRARCLVRHPGHWRIARPVPEPQRALVHEGTGRPLRRPGLRLRRRRPRRQAVAGRGAVDPGAARPLGQGQCPPAAAGGTRAADHGPPGHPDGGAGPAVRQLRRRR